METTFTDGQTGQHEAVAKTSGGKSSSFHHPAKYQVEASYSESTDRTGQGHDFRPVSVPHNKPEYCDHCGDIAWGIRQVLKCTRKFICEHILLFSF